MDTSVSVKGRGILTQGNLVHTSRPIRECIAREVHPFHSAHHCKCQLVLHTSCLISCVCLALRACMYINVPGFKMMPSQVHVVSSQVVGNLLLLSSSSPADLLHGWAVVQNDMLPLLAARADRHNTPHQPRPSPDRRQVDGYYECVPVKNAEYCHAPEYSYPSRYRRRARLILPAGRAPSLVSGFTSLHGARGFGFRSALNIVGRPSLCRACATRDSHHSGVGRRVHSQVLGPPIIPELAASTSSPRYEYAAAAAAVVVTTGEARRRPYSCALSRAVR